MIRVARSGRENRRGGRGWVQTPGLSPRLKICQTVPPFLMVLIVRDRRDRHPQCSEET